MGASAQVLDGSARNGKIHMLHYMKSGVCL